MARILLALSLVLLPAALLAPPAAATPIEDARSCVRLINARSDLESAIEHCTRAIGSRVFKGVNLAPLYYNRGWAHDELGHRDLAVEDYGSAIRIQPDYVPAYVARGYTRMSQGELDAAIEDYSRVLSVDPDVFVARFNRGLALEQKGELAAAMEDYRKAYELRPGSARAREAVERLERLGE